MFARQYQDLVHICAQLTIPSNISPGVTRVVGFSPRFDIFDFTWIAFHSSAPHVLDRMQGLINHHGTTYTGPTVEVFIYP
jgi:hypothetical protein